MGYLGGVAGSVPSLHGWIRGYTPPRILHIGGWTLISSILYSLSLSIRARARVKKKSEDLEDLRWGPDPRSEGLPDPPHGEIRGYTPPPNLRASTQGTTSVV